MLNKYGLPETIPQFIDGEMKMVPFVPEQYNHIKLSAVESKKAVEKFRLKFTRADHLTMQDMKEALRLGREKKFFQLKDAAYFKQVNAKR